MALGSRIRELRRAKHLTQEGLAAIIGNEGNTVSRWERNKIGIGSEYISKLAEALETSTDYLLGKTDNPTRALDNATAVTANESAMNTRALPSVPGLEFWGYVVDTARKAAGRSDPQELADVQMMLERALDAVIKARRVISSEQENGLPAAASA